MTAQNTPQRLAFIGGYGHHFLSGALKDEQAPIEAADVAVAADRCEPEQTRKKFSQTLENGAQWFDDPVRMLDEFKPTVVSIGGVYAHDAPLTLEALKRDIPVVAEKPIAATWDDYHALCEATQNTSRVLLTEFSFRSNPAMRAARQAVRDGKLGAIVLATAQKTYRFGDKRPEFYKRREDFGSTLLWVASHGIDVIYFTTGHRFTSVSGHHGNLAKPEYDQMEDHCAALYTLDNQGTAVAHADFLRPAAAATHGDDRLRLVGATGLIEVRDGRCKLTTTDTPEQDITDHVQTQPMHIELLDAVAQGGNDLYNTADSLTMAAALLAGRDACDTGQRVAIDAETVMSR